MAIARKAAAKKPAAKKAAVKKVAAKKPAAKKARAVKKKPRLTIGERPCKDCWKRCQSAACGAPGTQDGCGTCCVILINSPGSLRVKARHPAHPGWRAFRFQGTMLSCTTFPQ